MFRVFTAWKAVVENECRFRLQCLRSDNGGEFVSKQMDEFCASSGITHQGSLPHSPRQAGTAERLNTTLNSKVRSILHGAGVPQALWGEAPAAAVRVKNLSPCAKLTGVTPEEAWT